MSLHENRPLYVYIAGPLNSSGRVADNIRTATRTAKQLRQAFPWVVPFVPHLFWFMEVAEDEPMGDDFWLSWDFEWVRRCDVLLRLPGESFGSDIEVEVAKDYGRRVFYGVEDFIAWLTPEPITETVRKVDPEVPPNRAFMPQVTAYEPVEPVDPGPPVEVQYSSNPAKRKPQPEPLLRIDERPSVVFYVEALLSGKHDDVGRRMRQLGDALPLMEKLVKVTESAIYVSKSALLGTQANGEHAIVNWKGYDFNGERTTRTHEHRHLVDALRAAMSRASKEVPEGKAKREER